jgi:hypothetical protein
LESELRVGIEKKSKLNLNSLSPLFVGEECWGEVNGLINKKTPPA